MWLCLPRAPPQVAVLRVLAQLGQVYSVMRVKALAEVVPFMSFAQVEHLIVTAVKHGYLQARSPRPGLPAALMSPYFRLAGWRGGPPFDQNSYGGLAMEFT